MSAFDELQALIAAFNEKSAALADGLLRAAEEHQAIVDGGNCIRGTDGRSPCERLREREASYLGDIAFLESQLRDIKATQARQGATPSPVVDTAYKDAYLKERHLADQLAEVLVRYVQDDSISHHAGVMDALEAHARVRTCGS